MRRFGYVCFAVNAICLLVAVTSRWLLPTRIVSSGPVEMVFYESALWFMLAYLFGFWCMARLKRRGNLAEGWMGAWAVLVGVPFSVCFSFFWFLTWPLYLAFLLALIVRIF